MENRPFPTGMSIAKFVTQINATFLEMVRYNTRDYIIVKQQEMDLEQEKELVERAKNDTDAFGDLYD